MCTDDVIWSFIIFQEPATPMPGAPMTPLTPAPANDGDTDSTDGDSDSDSETTGSNSESEVRSLYWK